MIPAQVNDLIFDSAFQLLPGVMNTPEARRIMLAIGWQESRFEHRVQIIGRHRYWWQSLKGPARGFWQFERGGGVRGVLNHRATRDLAQIVALRLCYPAIPGPIHRGMAHNDILAACFARLLLWTNPKPIPTEQRAAWNYYLDLWRPGKPHPETWTAAWRWSDIYA